MKLKYAAVLGAILLGPLTRLFAADAVPNWERAKPILVQSCFGCHAPDLAPAPAPVRGSDIINKRRNVQSKASTGFGMGDKFPFSNEDNPKEQLKAMKKMLTQGKMPPKKLASLQLGKSLSTADLKTLLAWIAEEQAKK